MIVRVGVDIIGVQRVARALERWGDRFLQRVFTEGELAACGHRVDSLAGRFAAKEAVLKALGTGLDQGICWRDVEIVRDSLGLSVRLHGRAREQALRLGLTEWTVSISHSDGFAAAVAVGYCPAARPALDDTPAAALQPGAGEQPPVE